MVNQLDVVAAKEDHDLLISQWALSEQPNCCSTIPIAVGAALTAKRTSSNRVVTIFIGDGAMETGVVHESMNFASTANLPVLFVCENNLYSVYSPLDVRQPSGRSLSEIAKATFQYSNYRWQ